jgi:RimJ/RimL family protein N-acetyltransferase
MLPAASRRLRFRELSLADTFWLAMLCGQGKVSALLLGEGNEESNFSSAQKIIAVSQYCYQHRPGFGFWVTANEAGTMIGLFSLLPAEDDAAAPEMGVRLLPAFWARWYGVEGGRALCLHAFEQLKLPRVYAHTHPDNVSAQAVARRVGFRLGPACSYFSKPAQRLIYTKAEYDSHKNSRSENPE